MSRSAEAPEPTPEYDETAPYNGGCAVDYLGGKGPANMALDCLRRGCLARVQRGPDGIVITTKGHCNADLPEHPEHLGFLDLL